MFKTIASCFCLLFLSCSVLFGNVAQNQGPQGGEPPRTDRLDYTSPSAKIKLQRAEYILSTIVHDPQSYQLVLSSNPTFGGEAVPPGILAQKPTVIIYQGSLAPGRSNEELAFMMAHELGHLNLYHMEKYDKQMEKIFTGNPVGISGMTFSVFYHKLQEREADMFGLYLYKKAGYDIGFFPYTLNLMKINENIHFGSSKIFATRPTSLSMKDSHFSMIERFELLVAESANSI